jgi:hypothetical protein
MTLTAHYFKNDGFLEGTLTEEQMSPIKKYVETFDFEKAIPANHLLVGSIEKEYDIGELNKYIEELILPYAHSYYKQFRAHDTRSPTKLTLEYAWLNFQKKHEFNPIHMHDGKISFVIYVKVPYNIQNEIKHPSCKNSSRPLAGGFAFTYTNVLGIISSHSIPIDNRYENKILVFPAELNHSVYPFYTSDEYRITLAGNFS